MAFTVCRVSGEEFAATVMGASVDTLTTVVEEETGIPSADQALLYGNQLILYDEDLAPLAAEPHGAAQLLLVRSPGVRVADLLTRARPGNAQITSARLAHLLLNAAQRQSVVRKIFEHALAGPDARMMVCADLLQAVTEHHFVRSAAADGDMPQTVWCVVNSMAQAEFEDALRLDMEDFLGLAINVTFSEEDSARAVAVTRFLSHLYIVGLPQFLEAWQVALLLVSGICHTGPQRAAVHVECLFAFMSVCRSKIDDEEEITDKLERLRASRAADGQACFSEDMRAKMQRMIEGEYGDGGNL